MATKYTFARSGDFTATAIPGTIPTPCFSPAAMRRAVAEGTLRHWTPYMVCGLAGLALGVDMLGLIGVDFV